MIALIDYGVGNLGSVRNALHSLQLPCVVTRDASQILSATHIVLPGVGAFGEAMDSLRALNLVEPLERAVLQHETPFLGICLGMQLLAERSTEYGEHRGLGWIRGTTERMTQAPSCRIPHVGWNAVKPVKESWLFKGIEGASDFYFVHSFVIKPDDADDLLAVSEHGATFCAAVQRRHVMGVQFHPEKSHRCGLRLLRNFAEWRADGC